MKVYYTDYKELEDRRDWIAMLGIGAKEVVNSNSEAGVFHQVKKDAAVIEGIRNENVAVNDGMIVAHLGTWSKEIITWDAKLSERNLWLVAVSGSGYRHDIIGTERIYFRKTLVKTGKYVIDEQFRDCFREFIDDLNEQESRGQQIKPRFDLLDPSGVPEYLLAWVLAKKLKNNEFACSLPIERVKEQFLGLKKAIGNDPKRKNIVSGLDWTEDYELNAENAARLIQAGRGDL